MKTVPCPCLVQLHIPIACVLVDPKYRSAIELNFASINDLSDYLAIGYFVTSLSTSTADLIPVKFISMHLILQKTKVALCQEI